MGSTRDEFVSFILPNNIISPSLNETDFDQHWLSQRLNDTEFTRFKEIYAPGNYEYPTNLGNYSQWYWTAMRAETDQVPGLGPCATRWLARMFEKGGTPAIYVYFFTHPMQSPYFLNSIPGTGPGTPFVPHGSDIPFVLGIRLALANSEKNLSMSMSKYWSHFAEEGTPNTFDLPAWPAFTRLQDEVLEFGTSSIHTKRNLRKEACDFWDEQFLL